MDIIAFYPGHFKAYFPVIDKDRVPGVAVSGKAFESSGNTVFVPRYIICSNNEFLAFGKLDLIFAFSILFNPAAADLRPLKVHEYSYILACCAASFTDIVINSYMLIKSPVGAVDARYVHPRFNEFGQCLQ